MKKFLIAVLLMATPAMAQDREFTIKVNQKELETIAKALGKQPFDEAAPVIQKLQQQIAPQVTPPAQATPVPPAPLPTKPDNSGN